MLVVMCILGATFEAANVLQNGASEISTLGVVLQLLGKLLTQPLSNIYLLLFTKESVVFWPALALNSIIWATLLSMLWSKLERENT